MKLLFTALFISMFFFTNAAAQNTSIYTSVKTQTCRTIRSTDKEAGSYEGECKGVGGYKLRLIEGDLRQTIDVVTPAGKKFELSFWTLYGGFSSIGDKVEWRTKKGVPVALIARYNVANAEDSTKQTSYLLVAKLSKASACVTDVVEPGADQNASARKLADTAARKPCKAADQQ